MIMYYEVRVKRTCITDGNAYGTLKESYLVNAVSYTDAEASVARYMETVYPGAEYSVQRISKSRVESYVQEELADGQKKPEAYYKVRCAYVEDIDGHAKKRKVMVLVNAFDVEKAALTALSIYDSDGDLKHEEVVKVEKTSIVDVIDISGEELRS